MAENYLPFERYRTLLEEQERLGRGLQNGFRDVPAAEQQESWRRLGEIPSDRIRLFEEMRASLGQATGDFQTLAHELLSVATQVTAWLAQSDTTPEELLGLEGLISMSSDLHRVARDYTLPLQRNSVSLVHQQENNVETGTAAARENTFSSLVKATATADMHAAEVGATLEAEHATRESPSGGQKRAEPRSVELVGSLEGGHLLSETQSDDQKWIEAMDRRILQDSVVPIDTERNVTEDLMEEPADSELSDSVPHEPSTFNAESTVIDRDPAGGVVQGSGGIHPHHDLSRILATDVSDRHVQGGTSPIDGIKDILPETVADVAMSCAMSANEYPMAWLLVRWLELNHTSTNALMHLPSSQMLEVAHLGHQTLSSASKLPHALMLHALQNDAPSVQQGSIVQQALAFAVSAPLQVFRGVDASLWIQPLAAVSNPGVPEWLRNWANVVMKFGWRSSFRPFHALRPANQLYRDRKRDEIVRELEETFRQWRIHNFAFFLGNRFRQVVFPLVEGAGPLDWILREARRPKPDFDRLHKWADEWHPEEYLEEVVDRIRPPYSDDFFGRPKHYVLVRLTNIRDSVRALLETSHNAPQTDLTDDVNRFITDSGRLLSQAKHELPRLPQQWSVAQAWLRTTISVFETHMGG